MVECYDAVGQALGVVQPVHADGELATAKALHQGGGGDAGCRAGGGGGESGDIDADRIDDDMDLAALAGEGAVGAGPDAEDGGDTVAERRAVFLGVEADHVTGAERFQ